MGLLAPCIRCERVREIVARDLCNGCYTSWKRWMNPERALEHAKKYRETHREHVREYQREWNEKKRRKQQAQQLDKDANIGTEFIKVEQEVYPVEESGNGSFNIAIQTPMGRSWLIGRFTLVLSQDNTDNEEND